MKGRGRVDLYMVGMMVQGRGGYIYYRMPGYRKDLPVVSALAPTQDP